MKDVLCRKDGLSWVAAAYFPTTGADFSNIKSKFEHDFPGVAANNGQAFAFFVNQPVTIGERQTLSTLAGDTRTEIYHLERIRSLLDAPKGCGVRLEYLRIPMTEAEQWAFWNAMNHDVIRRLADHEARQEAQFHSLEAKIDLMLSRTNSLGFALLDQPSHLRQGNGTTEIIDMPTGALSLATLCWLHRVITEDSGLPEAVRGRLRSVGVWVGPAGSTPDTAKYLPPAPEVVRPLTESFIQWWREKHPQLLGKARGEIVPALAEFHHRFLRIHPFLDANGRLARTILDQAARELLNQGIGTEFILDAPAYFSALAEADAGSLDALQARIDASLK